MLQIVSFPKLSTPPVTADFETVTHPAQAGAASAPVPGKLFRSADGKMCTDFGDKSMISNPGAQEAILLDHVKKEALVFPMTHEPQPPALPGSPPATAGSPLAPAASALKPLDLGKKIIDGHEAEGKQYTVQPPKPFTPPAFKPPAPPPLPHAARLPVPPLPAPPVPVKPSPPQPHTVEVWTNPKLHMPLLTKVRGKFGQQTTRFKPTATGEPPASKFQIPPGYKVVKMPKPPKLPA